MSSTNRGTEKVPHENYPTPAWCVRRLLDETGYGVHRDIAIFEPCCGDGAIVRALWSYAIRPDCWLDAMDLNCGTAPRCHGFATGDSLHPDLQWRSYDLVITNPPFSRWHEVATKGLASGSTTVALLLRIGALAHLEGLPVPSVYVLPNRPVFSHTLSCFVCDEVRSIPWNAPAFVECPSCGHPADETPFFKRKAGTDSSEYAWFVWNRDVEPPTVHVLDDTTLEERKAGT